jgi:hypothetical protein
MQDRTSASMKVLLQRTAGPYIGVNMSPHGSALARPVYLQQRTYLVTAGMAVECQMRLNASQQEAFTRSPRRHALGSMAAQ